MGFFSVGGPTLLIADVKMIKQLLVKNFSSFLNRGASQFVQSDRLRKMLIGLRGDQWRSTRHTILPMFTASKIKLMAHTLNECTEAVILQKLRESTKDGQTVEIKELYGAFSICCIGVAGFGLQLHSHSEDDESLTLAAFEKNAKDFFSRLKSTKWLLIEILQKYIPYAIIRYFDIGLVSQESENFFFDMSADLFKKRKEGRMQGDSVDFMQPMVNAHKDEDEEGWCQSSPMEMGMKKVKLSIDEVVAQCVMFLIAGYETTAACLIFASYLLACHPDVQEKLASEVRATIGGSGSHKVTFELISKMPYLDKVVIEALRLYPPIARVTRECTKDTSLQGMRIRKGTRFIVPIWTIHRDPELWPDPLTFNPDRFSAQNNCLNMDAFLSFGDGPRSCLGNRFALAEIKIALARILAEFKMQMAEDTPQTLELGKGVFLSPRHSVPLKFVPLA
ncbi:cytochrome P450 3A13-like isoform X2 [Acanthaster planci]|nr:cytochrome P450 3A13-like isoform X2 [Acanthaster planci]